MKVLMFNKEIDFDPSERTCEELFEMINWELQKQGKVISSLIIDGTEVHNNHMRIVEENIGGIKQIEVIAATRKELALENIELLRDYLDKIIPEITIISKEFATGIREETWLQFEGVIRGLIFMEGVMGDILGMLLAGGEERLVKLWGKAMEEYKQLNDILKDLEEHLDHEQLQDVTRLIEKDMDTILKNVLQIMKRMQA